MRNAKAGPLCDRKARSNCSYALQISRSVPNSESVGSIKKPLDARGNFISNPPEDGHSLFGRPCGFGRIVEGPMVKTRRPREDRTGFPGPVTNRDHVIEALPDKLLHAFGSVLREINTDFPHGVDRAGVQDGRARPRAGRVEPVAGKVAQKALGHLAAAGIPRAEK